MNRELNKRINALETAPCNQSRHGAAVEFVSCKLTKDEKEEYIAKVEAANPGRDICFFIGVEMP